MKSVSANKEKGQATVVYDTAKTNPANLVKQFNKIGGPKYSASEMQEGK